MYLAGLIFACIGWVFQAYETLVKKTRNISIFLPAAYFLSCILFAISSMPSGDMLYVVLDAVLAVITAAVFIKLVAKKKGA